MFVLRSRLFLPYAPTSVGNMCLSHTQEYGQKKAFAVFQYAQILLALVLLHKCGLIDELQWVKQLYV